MCQVLSYNTLVMGFGLYIHYPYCRRICPFCDFVVRRKSRGSAGQYDDATYLKALSQEMRMNADLFSDYKLQTIYFGGGTPSLMSVAMVEVLLQQADKFFSIASDAEITLEVDPTTADVKKISDLKKLGINRFSLGIQSFHDRLLRLLGRGHTGEDACRLIHICERGGADHLSADLMFGIPDQTEELWQQDLEQVAAFPSIRHISLYNLTVAPDGRFIQRLQRLRKSLPAEERQLRMPLLADTCLKPFGFEQYEITAWAKPGFMARHNCGYWLGHPYLGLGVGAHSYLPRDGCKQRWQNEPRLNAYLQRLQNRRLPTAVSEELTVQQQMLEFVMLRFRLRQGVAREELRHFLSQGPQQYSQLIDRFVAAGWMQWRDERLCLSNRGIAVSNEIFSEFCLTADSPQG